MDRQEIERVVDRGWTHVRLVSLALFVSVVMHVAIGWALVELVFEGPLLRLPFGVAASVALVGASLILIGYLSGRSIRAGASRSSPESTEAAWARYVRAEIIAAALREAAAVVGLVLTVLTGDVTWVAVLGAAALFSMTVHLPRRAGALDWLVQQRTTG